VNAPRQPNPWQVVADVATELLRGGQNADIRMRAALRVLASAGVDFDDPAAIAAQRAPELAAAGTPEQAPPSADELLGQAAKALMDCAKAALTVKPMLDKPYPDDPRWSPWTRWVEPRARRAHDLAMVIRRHLKAMPAAPATPGQVADAPPALFARWCRVDTGPGTSDETIAERWRTAFSEDREFWTELDAAQQPHAAFRMILGPCPVHAGKAHAQIGGGDEWFCLRDLADTAEAAGDGDPRTRTSEPAGAPAGPQPAPASLTETIAAAGPDSAVGGLLRHVAGADECAQPAPPGGSLPAGS
jgi:hypothetical protein